MKWKIFLGRHKLLKRIQEETEEYLNRPVASEDNKRNLKTSHKDKHRHKWVHMWVLLIV